MERATYSMNRVISYCLSPFLSFTVSNPRRCAQTFQRLHTGMNISASFQGGAGTPLQHSRQQQFPLTLPQILPPNASLAAPERTFPPVASDTVTPDEVLALGVLTLAGLWPGVWCGIAAIIVQKVEQLAQKGAADAPFRRCAQSLVDILLRSPGKDKLAAETWQNVARAQARLPEDLAQVLGMACSLLQRRATEDFHTQARKKRRRALSLDTVAALSTPFPRFSPPCTAAMVAMGSGLCSEEEEVEEMARGRDSHQAQMAVSPPSCPSPPPPSMRQSREHESSQPEPLLALPAMPYPLQRVQQAPQLDVSPAAAVRPESQLPPTSPPSPSLLSPLLQMPAAPVNHLHNGHLWGGDAPGGGSAGMDYPTPVDHSAVVYR